VATKLEIADRLESGPKSLEELANLTQSNSESLNRLLQMLAGFGVFEEVSPHVFSNTDMSRLLIKSSSDSLHSLSLFYGEDINKSWPEILSSIQTGVPAFEISFNQPVFAYFKNNPERASLFQAAMKEKSRAVIKSHMNFVGVERLLNFDQFATDPSISSSLNQGFVCAWTQQYSLPAPVTGPVPAPVTGSAAAKYGSASLTDIIIAPHRIDTPSAYSSQTGPQIGNLSNGNTVYIYLSNSYLDLVNPVISGKLFDSNNNVIGSQFNIPGSTGARGYPRVVVHDNGFIVFFTKFIAINENSEASHVCAQRYDNQGNAQGGLLLDPPSSTSPASPEAACSQDSCLAIWTTSGAEDFGTSYGISGQFISPLNGTTLVNRFQVNQFSIDSQWLQVTKTLTSGRYLVAYSSFGQNTGTNDELWFKIYKSDGSTYVAETFVEAYHSTDSPPPSGAISVVALPNDEFLLVWASNLNVTSDYDIKAKRFSGQGQSIGSTFIVNTMTTGDQVNPVSTLLATGEVVVVWEYDSNNIASQILSIALPTPTPSTTPIPSLSSTNSNLVKQGETQKSKVPTWVIIAASVSSVAFLALCCMFFWCVSRYRKLKKIDFSSIFNGKVKISSTINSDPSGKIPPQLKPSTTIITDFGHNQHSLTLGHLTVSVSDDDSAGDRDIETNNHSADESSDQKSVISITRKTKPSHTRKSQKKFIV